MALSTTAFEGTYSNGDIWMIGTPTGLTDALSVFEKEREGRNPSKILAYYAGDLVLLVPVTNEMRHINIHTIDFPYIIINNSYCVLLSKTPFTTTVNSSIVYTFYKAMISDESITYIPTTIPVYNNIAYTMCTLMNALAEINPHFSFNVSTNNVNTINFTFTVDDYIPIITGPGIYNALTSEYMSDHALYFEDLLGKQLTQTIVLNNYEDYDSVIFTDARDNTISLNPIKYCLVDGDWPHTFRGKTATLTCPQVIQELSHVTVIWMEHGQTVLTIVLKLFNNLLVKHQTVVCVLQKMIGQKQSMVKQLLSIVNHPSHKYVLILLEHIQEFVVMMESGWTQF